MNRKKVIFGKQVLVAIALIFFSMLVTPVILKGAEQNCKSTNDLEIKFDFRTGILSTQKSNNANGPFVVNKGRNIIFKVININPFIYKVTINGEVVTNNYNTTDPGAFSSLVNGKKEKETEKNGETAKRLLDGRGNVLAEPLTEAIKQLKEIKKFHSDLSGLLSKVETVEQLVYQKNQICKDSLKMEPKNPSEPSCEVIDECNKRIENAQSVIKEIDTEYSKGDGKKNWPKLKEEIIKLLNYDKTIPFDELKEKVRIIAEKVDSFRSNDGLNPDEIAVRNAFELKYGTPKDFFYSFLELKSLLEELDKDKTICKIKVLLQNAVPEMFFVSLTVPTVDADEVKFTVTIEHADKEKKDIPIAHQLKSPMIVKVKGGWLLDFSTGVFFNVYAQDQEYWLEDVPSDSTKVILRTKNDKWLLSPIVGALMHIYPRQTRSVKWSGIAFGLGTGAADKLSYYLGTGIMLGNKSRFLINFGLTAVKVDCLLPKYQEKVDAEEGIVRPEKDVPLVQGKYKIRGFISLTYNL